jgi:hypothetical protein
MEKVDTMEWKDGPCFTGGAVVVGVEKRAGGGMLDHSGCMLRG